MGERVPQTYANHTKWDPLFHFFLLPVVLTHLVLSIWKLIRQPGVETAWLTVLALAALVAVFKIRTNALSVQDRVIRLEERLRLAPLLGEPLRSRLGELTAGQLVALRFASDAEIPALVDRVLRDKMRSKDIKKAIVTWRPDYQRV